MDSALNYLPLSASLIYLLLTSYKLYTLHHPSGPISTNTRPKYFISSQPLRKICKCLVVFLPTILLLTSTIALILLLQEPQRIIHRGSASFVILTDFEEKDRAFWDAWWAEPEGGLGEVHNAGDSLSRLVSIQRVLFPLSALLSFAAVVDEGWCAWKLWGVRKREILSCNKRSGDEYDESVGLQGAGCRRRVVLVLLAVVLGLAGGVCPVAKAERRFVMAVDHFLGVNAVGWHPVVDIEWSRCRVGNTWFWFCNQDE